MHEEEQIPKNIGRAVFALMEQKSFEKISYQKEAGVGRTTHYRYFQSENGKKEAVRCYLYGLSERRLSSYADAEERDRAFLTVLYDEKEKLVY
ncbi:MAG: hypothetical protein MR580_04070 [Anaerolactibacter massiliensis]|nr:hypothetical protein [Anaerolactibacter massiliensis]